MSVIPLNARVLYRVPEAMALLSMSRSAIDEPIRSNRLRSVEQGRCRLIPGSAITDYAQLLEDEAQAEAASLSRDGRIVVALCSVPKGRQGRPSKSLTLQQAGAILAADEGTSLHASSSSRS